MQLLKFSWLIMLVLLTTGCAALKPKPIGVVDGKLHPCPPAPKCVSSYYTSGMHHIDPLTYTSTKEEAYQKLVGIIKSMENHHIITRTDDYIHVQFAVTSIKWIDDVEFLFDKSAKIIHYSSSASASIGYWDWGENKRRARKIHYLFNIPANK